MWKKKIFRLIALTKGKIALECTRTAAMANKLENINCQEREQMVSRALKRFHNTRKNPKRTPSLEYNNFLYLTFLPLYAFLQAIAHSFHVYVLFWTENVPRKILIQGNATQHHAEAFLHFRKRREWWWEGTKIGLSALVGLAKKLFEWDCCGFN